MWLDRYAALCRDCPDLVAVYESAGGRLALLLRQTPVPLTQEYLGWRADTRHAARAIIDKLRGAGFRGGAVVLQWLPPDEVAEIMRTWPCRYEGDAARRAQLTAVAERDAADERFLAAWAEFRCHTAPGADGVLPPFATSAKELRALRRWYDAMAPRWLGLEPVLRRALVLRSHRWIADRVLIPAADGQAPALEDLEAGGSLQRALAELIPPDELADWRPWICLVLTDLERALRRPVAEWNHSWVRCMFLIPVSIPVPTLTWGSPSAAGRAVQDGRPLRCANPPRLGLPSRPGMRRLAT
jgi:hypothetical protein